MDDKQIILYGKKMFRITVDSADGDKINIQLPVAAVKALGEFRETADSRWEP